MRRIVLVDGDLDWELITIRAFGVSDVEIVAYALNIANGLGSLSLLRKIGEDFHKGADLLTLIV